MNKQNKPKKGYYRATPLQIQEISEAADMLSGMIGVGSDYDIIATRIVKNIDKFLKANNLERQYE